MTFKRVVNVIEVLTLVVAIAFVVALFANEPGGGSGATAKSGPGYDVYLANCARCHGQDGQGGVGPKLAGGAVVSAFPDPADQIRLVGGRPGRHAVVQGRPQPGPDRGRRRLHADGAQVAGVTSTSSAFLSTLCIPERGRGVSRTTRRRGSL